VKRRVRYLVIQTNSEGRPCGWGLSFNEERAAKLAEAQYSTHGHGNGCYPGEEKGRMVTHKIWVRG